MALKRKYQVLAAVEPQPGVLATGLLAAGNAKILPIDPSLSIDVENVDRDIVRGSLTPATSIQGLEEATVTFGVELSGSTSGGPTAVPVWDILMRACGMRAAAIRSVGLNTSFGTGDHLLHGEVVTGGTSGTTGRVIMDTHQGQSILRFELLTGGPFTTTEDITGGTSGNVVPADVAGSADAALGRAWWPVSSNRIQLDYTSGTAWADGDLLKGGTSGAIVKGIGAGGASGSDQEFEVLYGTLTDGEVFTGIAGSSGVFTYTAATISYEEFPTLSLAIVEDGVITTLRGCRGTFSISAEIGQPVTMNFEFKGVTSSVADGVAVTGVTYDTPVPPKFLGVDFAVAGLTEAYSAEFTPRLSSAGFDLANNVALRKDATDSTGNLWAEITGRQPTATLDPELLPEASFAWLGKLRSGDTLRLRTGIGSSASNRFKLFAPAVKVGSAGSGDREGFAVREISGQLSGQHPDATDGEDNELVLTYEGAVVGW